MNNIRELSAGEIECVAGGNPVVGFLVGYVATKILDAIVDDGPSGEEMVKQREAWVKKVKGGGSPW
jgi:hypothetical protein